MDEKLLAFLRELSTFGRENDGAQTDRAKKMLNIAPDTGRLLWIGSTGRRVPRAVPASATRGYRRTPVRKAGRPPDTEVSRTSRAPVAGTRGCRG